MVAADNIAAVSYTGEKGNIRDHSGPDRTLGIHTIPQVP